MVRMIRRALVHARKQHGLSQTDVARRLGIAKCTVQSMEHGQGDMMLSTLLKWSDVVGIEVFILDRSSDGKKDKSQ